MDFPHSWFPLALCASLPSLENKVRALFTETWSPHVTISPKFQLSVPPHPGVDPDPGHCPDPPHAQGSWSLHEGVSPGGRLHRTWQAMGVLCTGPGAARWGQHLP